MIDFQWFWLVLLLPLPLVIRYFLKPIERRNEAALRVPFMHAFSVSTPQHHYQQNYNGLVWLALLAWCLLVMAAMRPQWHGDFIELPRHGRDLMLAVDLSGSMKTRDFILQRQRVDRLTAIKSVAGDFIERRIGDRLGLILFGDHAYLQAPLTFDRTTVKTLLDESVIGLAGEKTAIGDAIGLTVKVNLRQQREGDLGYQRLRADNQQTQQAQSRQDEQNPVLVLLTDGANNAGVNPLTAAKLAAREALTIYTIGIGVSGYLDEKTLTTIATETGGRYFRAKDTAQLEQIYQLLDQLAPTDKDVQRFRPKTALFYYPLAGAFLGFLILVSLRHGLHHRGLQHLRARLR